MASPLDAIKNKAASKVAAALAQTPDPDSSESPKTPKSTATEKVYQTYKSGMDNQRIVMPSGKIIRVTAHEYITDKQDEIDFLDAEIEAGFPYLSKSGEVTSSDLDPMSALRNKIIAEYEAEKKAAAEAAQIASGIPAPVLGDTKKEAVSPASTADLGAVAAGSNSAASK